MELLPLPPQEDVPVLPQDRHVANPGGNGMVVGGVSLECMLPEPSPRKRMAGAIIIGTRCPYCTKFRSPADLLQLAPNVVICHDCLHRHEQAVQALSEGKPPEECSECHRSLRELALQSDKQVSMAIHYENGLYRAMCMACDAVYVPKRSELYSGTPFAKERGI